ncbi:MAG TPA: glycosyltransferase 87 family protein [Candidatus Limnocylindrales bacterium]|nr:glycosyltransferase 87 family protein [Candidatus Limnocylindrales bacterium]
MDRRALLAAGLVLAAGAWFVAGPVLDAATVRTYGFPAYFTSSRLVLDGDWTVDVYDNAWFHAASAAASGGSLEIYRPNTPVMSLLALPIAGLDYGTARLAWLGIQVALIGLTVGVLLGAMPRLRELPVALGLAALVLAFAGVRDDVRLGQAYTAVGLLGATVMLAVARGPGSARPGSRDAVAGLAVGAAVAAKLAAIPVALVLAVRGAFRPLAWALAGAAVLALATVPFAGVDGWLRFVAVLAEDVARQDPMYATPVIQSNAGLLTHLLVPDRTWNPWAVADAPVMARILGLGLTAAILGATLTVARRGPAVPAVALGLTAGVLVQPLAQEYHGAMLVAPVAVAIARWLDDERVAGNDGWIRAAWLGLAVVLVAAPLPYRELAPPGGWLDVLWYPRLAGTWLLWAWFVDAVRRGATDPESAGAGAQRGATAGQRAAPVTR